MEKEEKILWAKYQKTPSDKNRNLLIEHYHDYLSLVAFRAHVKTGLPSEDCYQYAVFGIMQSIPKYDSSKNTSFKGYAYRRVLGAAIDGWQKETHSRSPYQVSMFSYDSLAFFYDIDDAQNDLFSAEDKTFEGIEWEDYFGNLCDGLDPLYQSIARLRFCVGLTQKEIAEAVGIGPSRVSQILQDKILPLFKERLSVRKKSE